MHRRLLTALVLSLWLTGCASAPAPTAGHTTPQQPPVPPAITAPVDAQPAAIDRGADTAASLFPDQPLTLTYLLRDFGKPPVQVEESLVPVGHQVLAVGSDHPYAAWIVQADGVWRRDPAGKQLLRYLPPVLKDGDTWQHPNGTTPATFRLRKDRCIYGDLPNPLPSGECWSVTVQMASQRTTFWFVPGQGPTAALTVNYAQPEASFYKELQTSKPLSLTPAHVALLQERAPATPAVAANLLPATPAQFEAALDHYPGVQTVPADLDGDGQQERIRGVLDAWTPAPLEIFSASGELLYSSTTSGLGQRITLFQVPTFKRTLPLVHSRGNGYPDSVGALSGWRNEQGMHIWELRGWDPKSSDTPATRVRVADGVITVEWDLGDPALHTRIRTYTLAETKGQPPYVQRTSQRYAPQGAELRYPTDPLAVLQAAFNTRWLKLPEETARYFATPAAAQAFLSQPQITEPNYGPGDVRFAQVNGPDGTCTKATPATLGDGRDVPFEATWGGYEWGAAAWGTVTFRQDTQQRTVIQQLTVKGSCESGE